MTLINALKNNLSHSNVPFNHWIINNPLSEKAIDEIYSINFPEGKVIFDGTRAGDKKAVSYTHLTLPTTP